MAGVERIDTFGAWRPERLVRGFAARGRDARVIGLPDHYRGLVDEAHAVNRKAIARERPAMIAAALAVIGRRDERGRPRQSS